MRRSDREITDLGEILSIINDCKVIHLAMVDDGEPYLLPLNFGYACESGAFSFFCHSAREGRKLDILRKNPTVAFEMDCRGALDEHDVACQCGYYFASVTGVGHVEFLDGEEKLVALTSLMRHMAGREDQFTEQQARTVEVFAVRADKLSAKAKVPPTLFIATLEEELEVISVCNLSGEVCKETLGTRKRTHLASNLAEFLNQLKPLL